jgi:hypothetical protein
VRFVELPARAGGDDDLVEDEDAPTIGVRVRETAVARWELAPVGGVDAGLFGVWDASRAPVGPAAAHSDVVGLAEVQGRPAFVIGTGDGVFGCVVGRDATDAIAVLVAGPLVDGARFGIVDPASVVLPEGEVAAKIAASGKAKRQKQLAAAIAWGIERWRVLLDPLLPKDAAGLANLTITTTKRPSQLFPWMKPVIDAHDYGMSSLRFDLTQALGPDASAQALSEVTADLRVRVGAVALDSLRTIPDVGEDLTDAIRAVAKALASTLELHALAHRKDPASPTVSDRVAALAPIETLATRL